jgi:membrane protein YqaA with SNARE-associated domain
MGVSSLLAGLKGQVSKPYFPVVIFALAMANTFAVFLSGLVTTLFVSTCVAVGKKRFAFVALCNALGATCGFALFAWMLEARGADWFRAKYPEAFASRHWARGEKVVADFGWQGVMGLSALPFPLHPLVALGVLAGMRKRELLVALFIGRLAKYLVFGWIATNSPGAMRRLKAGAAETEKEKKK